jgi:hypothetical protein
MSTRTKAAIGIGTTLLLLVAGFVGFRMATRAEGEPLLPDIPLVNDAPASCPLTGQEPNDEALMERRVLAVKIENSPDARPQMGLEEADIVYEAEAEGGITRFIVVYHCRDGARIGPIRSARETDPVVLLQYEDPLFVHSGGVGAVIRAIDRAGIEQINCNFEEETCPRDESREAPHNVYSSTEALRDFSNEEGDTPEPVFTFDKEVPERVKRGREVHLDFSPSADVFWRYRNNTEMYVRFHGEEPHRLEDGSQVAAANVVVMMVERLNTNRDDVAGNPVPAFDVVGSGDLLVFRNGKVIEGTWERDEREELTLLLDRQGDEIALAPGRTWVELFPTDAPEPPQF